MDPTETPMKITIIPLVKTKKEAIYFLVYCLVMLCVFQVVIRPMMYIALTYDHRLVDGREAVTFLRTIKAAVEDPRVMLMDL